MPVSNSKQKQTKPALWAIAQFSSSCDRVNATTIEANFAAFDQKQIIWISLTKYQWRSKFYVSRWRVISSITCWYWKFFQNTMQIIYLMKLGNYTLVSIFKHFRGTEGFLFSQLVFFSLCWFCWWRKDPTSVRSK